MIVLWLYFRTSADASPIGMLLAFGPRWWLILPWLVLVPVAFFARLPGILAATIGLAVTLFGVCGFEIPAWRSPATARPAFRLVTYNTDRSALLASELRADLAAWDADIVLLQDCKTVVADSLRAIAPRGLFVSSEFCMASRFKLVGVDSAPPRVRTGTDVVGRFGNILRYRLQIPGGELPVYSVHLESPRTALWAARNLEFSRLETSIVVRGADSEHATQFVARNDSAFVVAGDFNLPYGSAILERDWGDLTNAFADRGVGFGYTMWSGRYAVRIDHVLTPSTLAPTAIRVERGHPSEHQPVIVDMAWRR
jgi:endonuclease/exonuclease/phosphatase family metal-dependent hydrolase